MQHLTIGDDCIKLAEAKIKEELPEQEPGKDIDVKYIEESKKSNLRDRFEHSKKELCLCAEHIIPDFAALNINQTCCK